MGDNLKWFKVWTSILSDPGFSMLTFEDWGRWLKLVALIAAHGKNGTLTASENFFAVSLETGTLMITLTRVSSLNIEAKNDNGTVTVTLKNWSKYQAKSSSYKRVKRWRETHRVTLDKKRQEETRQEEKKEILKEKVFGEFQNVKMTEEEFDKLSQRFGPKRTQDMIENLSQYLKSKGAKYKSHYATLLNWARREKEPNLQDWHDKVKEAT